MASGIDRVVGNRMLYNDELAGVYQQWNIVKANAMGKKQRRATMQELNSYKGKRILIATGRYIGEGFDDSYLDTLFLALPISWSGTLQQYVGRLHRSHHGKGKVTVYDYVDFQVPTLARMFKKRTRGYKALGYGIEHSEKQS
jgi:superfamily II DNA or RNA helicase